MRTAVLAIVLALAGCAGMSIEEYELARRGLDPADFNAPPSDRAIWAAVVNDVRSTWIPDAELDRGLAACPAIRFTDGRPVCVTHNVDMKQVRIREDDAERQHPVSETAYYCPFESAYWYRYAGGPERRDAWLGPRPLKIQGWKRA